MNQGLVVGRQFRRQTAYLCWFSWAVIGALPGLTAPPPDGAEPLPRVLTLEAAVRRALQYNPELATQRQQHGIAAAGIVIANTYPFNPFFSRSHFRW